MVVGAVAMVVGIFALASGLEHGALRKTGEPHWSDQYVRGAAAIWLLVLAVFGYAMCHEALKK
jgi:hypothetical protein